MAHPIELLKADYEPIVWFFNPNIFPEKEYHRRKDELVKYCAKKGYELIVEDYEPECWKEYIKGFEAEPERGRRCTRCFEYRMDKTAQKASELGIKTFTTTLSVSPHKISKTVFKAGVQAAKKHGISFLAQDFKKQNGFIKTMEISKKENFYRQQYCGCEFSFR